MFWIDLTKGYIKRKINKERILRRPDAEELSSCFFVKVRASSCKVKRNSKIMKVKMLTLPQKRERRDQVRSKYAQSIWQSTAAQGVAQGAVIKE